MGNFCFMSKLMSTRVSGFYTVSLWGLNDKCYVCNQFIQWLMPSEGGYLEADGPVEKTWRIKQEDIGRAVDISSARNQHDVILPG